MDSAARGHKAVVELLVQREDVNVNSLSEAGRPPIFWPSAEGDEAIVSLLMVAGAEILLNGSPILLRSCCLRSRSFGQSTRT
jgi:ankyrin repeat protein